MHKLNLTLRSVFPSFGGVRGGLTPLCSPLLWRGRGGLTILLLFVSLLANAQTLPQGLGIQIGFAEPILRLNGANSSIKADSLVNKTKLNGFKVGVVYDASFIKGFGASIGVNYTFGASKTAWQQKNSFSQFPQIRTYTWYHQLELAVDWQYKFEIAKETYLILYSGPSVQCAVAMQDRTDTKKLGGDITKGDKVSRFSTDADADGHTNTLRRLNLTWGVGAGFQYQRYFLRGGYDFGLLNPYKDTNFNQMGYDLDRHTRGRLDQWNIRLGVYLWQN